MKRIFIHLAVVALLSSACGGATDSDVEGDLSEDFDNEATSLVAEPEPDDDATDDGDDDKGDHHKDKKDKDGKDGKHKKKKHRHHHLFKKLDRLDGDRNGEIVIASLPAKVPARVIEKLHEIDADHNGVVTREESHGHCKEMKHDWHEK